MTLDIKEIIDIYFSYLKKIFFLFYQFVLIVEHLIEHGGILIEQVASKHIDCIVRHK